jgi:hypothetical protein
MEISDQIIKSIIDNEKMTVNLLGFRFKVGWMKACTLNCILGSWELKKYGLISSKGFLARTCAALLVNDLFLLRTLYYILWRVLYFFVPYKCLALFAITCFDRELIDEYDGKKISLFIQNTNWLHKRRFLINMYDAKNVYSVAQLYLLSRDESIINYNDYGKKQTND